MRTFGATVFSVGMMLALMGCVAGAGKGRMMNTTIQRDGGRVWLEGVKGWSFAERASSVHAAQETVAKALGDPIAYDYLVGVSGLAFRMQITKEGFCPSSPHAWCGYRCADRSVEALPWKVDVFHLKSDDTAGIQEARRAIVRSIERGVPVQYGSEEDGVIVGYRRDGEELICFNPMRQQGSATFVETGWPWGVRVHGERKPHVTPRPELVKASLRQAVDMANTESADIYFVGFKAWDAYVQHVQALENADEKTRADSALGNAWTYECLVAHRRSAVRYLREVAADLPAEAAEHLKAAADCYERMADEILTDTAHGSMAIAPYPGSGAWTAEMRQDQIRRLAAALALERDAIQEIEKALVSMP